jgi:DNA replication and repair protein RecF
VVEALRISRIQARGFRNLRDLELAPGPRFNVLYGDNGQGKSNLLEAIDYLGSLRSFRGASAAEMIAQGDERALLASTLAASAAGWEHRHRVELNRSGARQVQVDGKRPRTRATYLTSIQTVLFHPGDLQLVAGPPDQRRDLVDRILERFDLTYAETLAAYERALRSRNRLLKADPPDRRAVTSYDEVLAAAGAVIGQARERLILELGELAIDAFRAISGDPERLRIHYAPRVEPEIQALRRALASSLEKDFARGFTAEGPHADDLSFSLDGVAAKRYGSQGQHRAIVLALKVAELHQLTRRVGRVPILLLDDVSSELDRTRNRRLFGLLSELGGQVFLTTTQPDLILLDQNRDDFRVEAGTIAGGTIADGIR